MNVCKRSRRSAGICTVFVRQLLEMFVIHTMVYTFGLSSQSQQLTIRPSPRPPDLPDCHFRAMATQQNLPEIPDVQFRVLIIGKANAGKTSILQRVCDTTKSPEIYSVDSSGARNLVRSRYYWCLQSHRLARFNSTLQWRSVKHILSAMLMSEPDICSVASMTSNTNLCSRVIRAMFSMTPADSRVGVKTS